MGFVLSINCAYLLQDEGLYLGSSNNNNPQLKQGIPSLFYSLYSVFVAYFSCL